MAQEKQTNNPPQDSILSIESNEFDAFFDFRNRVQVLQPMLHHFLLTFLDSNLCLSNFFHLRMYFCIFLDIASTAFEVCSEIEYNLFSHF